MLKQANLFSSKNEKILGRTAFRKQYDRRYVDQTLPNKKQYVLRRYK